MKTFAATSTAIVPTIDNNSNNNVNASANNSSNNNDDHKVIDNVLNIDSRSTQQQNKLLPAVEKNIGPSHDTRVSNNIITCSVTNNDSDAYRSTDILTTSWRLGHTLGRRQATSTDLTNGTPSIARYLLGYPIFADIVFGYVSTYTLEKEECDNDDKSHLLQKLENNIDAFNGKV